MNVANARRILLAEDNAFDVELVLRALGAHRLADRTDVARDGEEALDYLYCRGRYGGRGTGNPALVMLDLKMPKVDGIEVLRDLKSNPALKPIPVVVLTSSREQQDVLSTYRLGVNAYVVKPVEFEKFTDAIRQLCLFWLSLNEPPPD
jgi:CheY-like chemotaxis protein